MIFKNLLNNNSIDVKIKILNLKGEKNGRKF